MINSGLLQKNLRDSLFVFAFSCIGMIAFSFLFVGAMQTMGKELLEFVSKFKILAKIFEMGFGIKVSEGVTYQVLFGVCFTHLVTLSLSWIIVIASSMRPMVGEIENGTADILLTLPVTRTQVILNNMLIWVSFSALASFCPVIGIWLATNILGSKETIQFLHYIPVSANLFALSFVVGGICSLASSVGNKKGTVIAIVVAVLISSVTLNFVEPFFPALGIFKYVNLLYYFRPVDIIRAENWPWGHISILLTSGCLFSALAVYFFNKRDIATG